MSRFARVLLVVAAIVAVASIPAAFAGTVVDQGSGSTRVIDWSVSTAAKYAGKTTEVAVVHTAGGTAVPATALAGRKAIEIQNNGPNTIYCTVDGTAPVATTNGRWILTGNAWSIDLGPSIVVTCIAGVADQVSGAATMVTELR
jgi:hypothetical protein